MKYHPTDTRWDAKLNLPTKRAVRAELVVKEAAFPAHARSNRNALL